MRAATPLVIRKLRLDEATRLIEKYGVDMANSLRNAPKSPNPVRARSSRKSGPKCDDNQFLDKNRDGIKRHQGNLHFGFFYSQKKDRLAAVSPKSDQVLWSGGCLRLPLSAPAKQTQRAEAGGEE